MVLAALRQSGLALEFASDELRGDRGVVLAAVLQCVCAPSLLRRRFGVTRISGPRATKKGPFV